MGMEFDNVDDVLDNTVMDGGVTSAFSFSAWIYAYSDGGGSTGRIYQVRNASFVRGQALVFNESGGAMDVSFQHWDTFSFGPSLKIASSSDRPISINTWHNVIGRAKATGVPVPPMDIYVDGVEVTSYSQQDTPNDGLDDYSRMYLGNASTLTRCFDGVINEVAIWHDYLTASEIERLQSHVKRMPLQVNPANLAAYWPLDDDQGDTASHNKVFRDLSDNLDPIRADWGPNSSGMQAQSETVLSY